MSRFWNQGCFTRVIGVVLILIMVPVVALGAGEALYDEQGRWKGTKIYDEQGQWNGLFNSNPDPQGTPWIAGGLPQRTPEDEAFYRTLPRFSPAGPRADLPLTVRQTTSPYFRPVFTQWGGSCGQASGIGYHYTFERNQTLNRPYNNSEDNLSAYIFTWNFVNNGANQGSWPEWGYQIAQYMGAARESDFDWANGTFYTNWLSGYSEYFHALECRVKEDSIVTFDISDLAAMKSWLYDKGSGTGTNGGLITMAAAWPWDTSTVIPDGPFAGQKVVTHCPAGEDHALTIAGYSDEITVGGSTGAFLVVNSHGTSWGNAGMVWVMYDAFDPDATYYFESMETESREPLLVMRAVVTSERRNTVDMVTGYASQFNASAPDVTQRIPFVFNKTGGEYPMQGDEKSKTMEIAMDVSSFVPSFTDGRGTVFLQAQGDAVVNSLSLIYYGTDPPKEFFYTGTPVYVDQKKDLGISIDLSEHPIDESGVVNNYPNPFNTSTSIEYELKEESRVILRVFNARGQEIRTLMDRTQGYGVYTVIWDGRGRNLQPAPSGIYYLVAEINGKREMKKMVLLK
jgi:hypothetical protein